MAEVGCTLKLKEDDYDPYTVRRCELFIRGDSSRGGSWSLSTNSDDSRLRISSNSGSWGLAYDKTTGWTVYIVDDNWSIILVELYGLNENFLENISCGSGISGSAWHQGPPSSDLVHRLWFGCA